MVLEVVLLLLFYAQLFGALSQGALQHGAEVRRLPQHAAVRDVGQGPEGEPERGLHLHVAGVPPQGPEVPPLQRRGEGGRQGAAHTRDWNKEQLSLLRGEREKREEGEA